MPMTSRINKSTAVGAIAACAVIGATSPVWADSGSGGASTSSDTGQTTTSTQDNAVISALRAEIAKLQAQLKSEDLALRDATHAAAKEARALESARAEIAKLESAANSADTTPAPAVVVPAGVPAVDHHRDPAAVPGFAGHRCHHGDPGRADFGPVAGYDGHHSYGANYNRGSWRGR